MQYRYNIQKNRANVHSILHTYVCFVLGVFTGVGFSESEYQLRESNDEDYMIPVNVTGGRLPVDLFMSVSALVKGTAGWETLTLHSL